MKIIKSDIRTKHLYNNGVHTSYIEETEKYHYDSYEERNSHAKEMIENGFKDNGQVMENVGTIRKPEFVYFGSYYRYRRN